MSFRELKATKRVPMLVACVENDAETESTTREA